ncbi:hypothetical protein H5410_036309 [Solanum commersonii]|uniref:Uncharacterized protein n=1 Tax=Solanum commersonii TaxID=4109 RepID=A0A9J5Y4E5_SOLCO|nr:hypothetical protein H5410_036309 [Solanum commersonii]
MLLQITYHDKATQTETEEENTIEKILKVITTLSTKVDSMDNEIQKLKTNEDNLKSKASQQHDYKNAELRRSEDGKNPELKGGDGKLLKTHNICLNTTGIEPLKAAQNTLLHMSYFTAHENGSGLSLNSGMATCQGTMGTLTGRGALDGS